MVAVTRGLGDGQAFVGARKRFAMMTDLMSIPIALHHWETNTRPCDFSLNLETPRGTVFADFEVESEHSVTLRRISFDGYGCCEPERKCSHMPYSDSLALTNAVRGNDVNNQAVLGILRRYFLENASMIWSDALVEHQLI
jgi:hypothetical protein